MKKGVDGKNQGNFTAKCVAAAKVRVMLDEDLVLNVSLACGSPVGSVSVPKSCLVSPPPHLCAYPGRSDVVQLPLADPNDEGRTQAFAKWRTMLLVNTEPFTAPTALPTPEADTCISL